MSAARPSFEVGTLPLPEGKPLLATWLDHFRNRNVLNNETTTWHVINTAVEYNDVCDNVSCHDRQVRFARRQTFQKTRES